MSFICKFFRRLKAKKEGRPLPSLIPTMMSIMATEELLLHLHINNYLKSLGIPEVEINNYLLTFARFRTWFWDYMGYTHKDNLHTNVLGDIEYYVDNGLFTEMEELANYGIYNDLAGFVNHESHNKKLTNGTWKSIGISMRGKYCCIILGK